MQLAILKPNQKISCLFLPFSEIKQKEFTFTIKAKNKLGDIVTFENTFDLGCYDDWSQFQSKDIKELVQSFEKFQKRFDQVTTFSKLRVETYDKNDREEEINRKDEVLKKQRQP